jgi:hypothetical protein
VLDQLPAKPSIPDFQREESSAGTSSSTHSDLSKRCLTYVDIMTNIRGRLRELYHGSSARAVRFQRSVMAVDVAIIGFFLFVPLIVDRPTFYSLDYSIAAFILLDLVGRALASADIGLKTIHQAPSPSAALVAVPGRNHHQFLVAELLHGAHRA